MPKEGYAYLDGTVHVGKEVQTIQRYKLELWEKRYKPVTGTVHVGKCFPNLTTTPITAMGCRQCLPLSVVQQSLLSFVVVKIDQIEIVEPYVHLKKFPKLHNQLRERGETYIIG